MLPWWHHGTAKATQRSYQGKAVLLSGWKVVLLPAAYADATMGTCRCYCKHTSMLPAADGGAGVFSGNGGGAAIGDGGGAAIGGKVCYHGR